MAWPALLKARDNTKEIEKEISRMIKNHNSLTKKEMAKNSDTIAAAAEGSMAIIKEQMAELKSNLDDHRSYLESKKRFVRRHYRHI